MLKSFYKHILLWIGLLLVFVLLVWQQPQPVQQLNWLLQDAIAKSLADQKPVKSVLLIDIDETSIDLLGAWPWSRSLLAQLITKLKNEMGASVVGVDIVFPDKSKSNDDSALQVAVQQTQAILPIVWDYQGQTPVLQIGFLPDTPSQDDQRECIPAKGFLTSFAALNQHASLAHISSMPDSRGVMRFMPPRVCWQHQRFNMLALSMWQQAHRLPATVFPFHASMLDDQYRWRIPYLHADESFTVIPAWQVLAQELDAGLIRGKAVVIGSSALGLNDRVATPLSAVVPGMMLHAQMYAALEEGIVQVDDKHGYWYVLLLLTLLLLSWVLISKSILWSLVSWVGVLLLWVAVTVIVYWIEHQWLPVGLFLLVVSLWFLSQLLLEWALVRRHSQRIYNLFKDYLPPNVLQQLMSQPNEDALRPQQRVVTVLFADIAGFTTMTEKMPAEEVASLTRHILSALTQAVHEYDGTLDKYIGDALMAFWNAPMPQQRHAYLACAAAQKMREKLKEINQTRQAIGLVPIHVRIGVNTGVVLVGDLGTQWRHAYTLLGDAVNVAQRLMVAAGQLGVDVLVGEQTAEEVQGLVSVGEVYLPGREHREFAFFMPVDGKVSPCF